MVAAIYDQIVAVGTSVLAVRLAPSAYAHGLALVQAGWILVPNMQPAGPLLSLRALSGPEEPPLVDEQREGGDRSDDGA